jgi:hypothetical protein
MNKPTILIQIDTDACASVFDAVVAVDSGVDHLLQYAAVEPASVRGLVHGAIFTRGMKDLHQTAIFLGGSQVGQGEAMLRSVLDSFVGPLRVSVMMDANGSNTTAAAAVLAASRHVPLAEVTALVLAGTGPVGQRAVRLLARAGASVRVSSRQFDKAAEVCQAIRTVIPAAKLTPCVTSSDDQLAEHLEGANVVIAAGAAGVQLVPQRVWQTASSLRVAIDLNAVPPLGIEGTQVMDRAVERDGVICYGAIGVGGDKMKIHKAALRRLFERNDQVLDAEAIFAIAQSLT